LIPPSHSQELHAVCPMESYLHLPEKMDHNEFQLDEDLVLPFKEFVNRLDDQQKLKSKGESKSKGNEEQASALDNKNKSSSSSADAKSKSFNDKAEVKNKNF